MKQIKVPDIKPILDKRGRFFIFVTDKDCGPCHDLQQELDNYDKSKTDVDFYFIDITDDSKLKAYFPIQTLPYMLYFNNGRFIKGFNLKHEWQEQIQSIINPKQAKHKVVVFSTPTCPYCHMVKQYFNDKGIEFEDIDVSTDRLAAQRMVERSGQMGVPQIWIDDEVVIGYNVPRISALLGIDT